MAPETEGVAVAPPQAVRAFNEAGARWPRKLHFCFHDPFGVVCLQ